MISQYVKKSDTLAKNEAHHEKQENYKITLTSYTGGIYV